MTFGASLPTNGQNRRRVLLQLGAAMGAVLLAEKLLAQPQDKIKVAAVYSVPIIQSWVSRVHHALVLAQSRGEIEYVYSENIAASHYEAKLRQYANKGVQLIVGEAFESDAHAYQVAKDYPDIAFLIGSTNRPQQPNLAVFNNYIHEPTYLTGMIAGGLSQTGTIGLIASYAIPTANCLLHAFMDGVREINPDARFLVTFTHAHFDPPKARQAAFSQIDQGADVIYTEHVSAAQAAQQRGKLMIASMVDAQPLYPETIVASAVWDMGPTIERALTMVKRGTFKADDYGKYSQMRYQGATLAPLGTFEDKVPSALMARVRARQQTMLDGRFTIKPNDTPPQTSAPLTQISGK